MAGREGETVLTLEPLVDAVREGVEGAGWELSGLQKTTSHQFEGRWEGESTRSAYLFFHSPSAHYPVSIDVYLDETSRGLTGNLALVVDLMDLGRLGDPSSVLRELSQLSQQGLPRGYNTPLTLRLRLKEGGDEPGEAECEVRFKIRLPRATITAGAGEIRDLAVRAVAAFESLLSSHVLQRHIARE